MDEVPKMVNRADDPIAYQAEDFRARASNARSQAKTLTTQAEIWEDAAGRLEDAIEKHRRSSPSAAADPK
jgi:hypothetical protein